MVIDDGNIKLWNFEEGKTRVHHDQRVRDNLKFKKSAKLRYFARNYMSFYIYSSYFPTNEGYMVIETIV